MWNEVIERHPGISGSVFSSYVSLWARLPEITLPHVLDSFEETAELIRVPAMRNALMVFTPESYERVYPAFRSNLRMSANSHLEAEGVDAGLLQLAAEEIVEILGREDLAGPEIGRRLQRLKNMSPVTLAAVLNALCADRLLVRARVRDGFAAPRFTYAVWSEWVPSVRKPAVFDFRVAVSELATQYFDAYPGATVDDFRWWGGWKEESLQGLTRELEYSRLASAAKPLDEAWSGWHLLPPLDALPMGYRSAQSWVPAEWTPWVFDAAGNSTSVILRDGQVVGVWDFIQLEDILYEARVALFDPGERVSIELDQEVAALSRFLGVEVGDIVQVKPDRPLKETGENAFRSPLRDRALERE
jgi:hypothetical protein